MCNDDRGIARRALYFQTQARNYDLPELPGYEAWSERKLDEGHFPALIAHLDATSTWLLPEDVEKIPEQDFEEMLDDLRAEIEKFSD